MWDGASACVTFVCMHVCSALSKQTMAHELKQCQETNEAQLSHWPCMLQVSRESFPSKYRTMELWLTLQTIVPATN